MLCSKEMCTGCGACRNICNHQAITMVETYDGCYKPEVNDKCVKCGLCSKVCHQLNNKEFEDCSISKSYVFYNKNDEENKQSASGGAFYKLSEYVINSRKGVVFGAVFDKEFKPIIACASTLNEVEPMRGSKYAYSDTNDTYKRVKEYLKKDVCVLYSGLPCQISGLKCYLGKEYENLITVDILCHGAPGPNVIKKYINYLEEKLDDKVIKLDQRDSSEKWNMLITKKVKVETQSGKIYYFDENIDPYLAIYAKEIAYQESCYNCKYTSLKRNADFSIGDFGGLGLVKKFDKPNKNGISLVIVNSRKGESVLNKLTNVFIEERNLQEAMIFNTCLYKHVSMKKNRSELFEDYNKLNFEQLYKKYIESTSKDKLKLIIKRFIAFLNFHNYIAWIIYFNKKLNGKINNINKIYEDYLSHLKE